MPQFGSVDGMAGRISGLAAKQKNTPAQVTLKCYSIEDTRGTMPPKICTRLPGARDIRYFQTILFFYFYLYIVRSVVLSYKVMVKEDFTYKVSVVISGQIGFALKIALKC